MLSPVALLIFAKAPEPGRVKTRLLPQLSPAQAAAVHRACLEDTVAQVSRVPGCAKALWVAAQFEQARELAASLGLDPHWRVRAQRGPTLGARLQAAFASFFREGYRKIIVTGTDTPWMGTQRILRAISMLDATDVVLGPSTDGGYYLVAARRLVPEMFRAIPWGTSQVLSATLGALKSAHASFRLLPQDFDLDRPEDLNRAAALLREHENRAPALARLLAATGDTLSSLLFRAQRGISLRSG